METKTYYLWKADQEDVEPIDIKICAVPPRPDDIKEWEKLINTEGRSLAQLLLDHLPGGVLDAMLCELMKRKERLPMNQIILSGEPVSPDAISLKELEEKLQATMFEAGYGCTIGILVNNGWHPTSEKPKTDGDYIVIFGKNFKFTCKYTAKGGWNNIYEPRWWQPFPELPENEEES